MNTRRTTFRKKALAGLLAFTFLLTQVIYNPALVQFAFAQSPGSAPAQADNFWQARARHLNRKFKGDAAPVPSFDSALAEPRSIQTLKKTYPFLTPVLKSISPFTRIESSHDGKPGRPLVMIMQDVHLNLDAQKKIGQSLLKINDLIKGSDLDNGQRRKSPLSRPDPLKLLIGAEAASGRFDFASFQQYPHKDTVRAVSDELLRENIISAVSWFGFNNHHAGTFVVGVDDPALYLSNVESFKKAKPVQAKAVNEIKRQIFECDRKKDRILSPVLNKLYISEKEYSSGEGAIVDHVTLLAELAPALSIPPNLSRFLAALQLESELNTEIASRQRNQLIQTLSTQNSKAREALGELARGFQAGDLTGPDFYHAMFVLLDSSGIDLDQYAEFKFYMEYLRLSDAIDHEHLFNEIDSLTDAIIEKEAKTKEERRLIARFRNLTLADKLARFEMTPLEWKKYQNSRIPASLGLNPFESFYRVALKRNRAMIHNLTRAMKKTNPALTVLVSGGFHTEGMARLLKEQGLSYVIVSPRLNIETISSGAGYLNDFLLEKTSLERLLEGDKLTLALARLQAGVPAFHSAHADTRARLGAAIHYAVDASERGFSDPDDPAHKARLRGVDAVAPGRIDFVGSDVRGRPHLTVNGRKIVAGRTPQMTNGPRVQSFGSVSAKPVQRRGNATSTRTKRPALAVINERIKFDADDRVTNPDYALNQIPLNETRRFFSPVANAALFWTGILTLLSALSRDPYDPAATFLIMAGFIGFGMAHILIVMFYANRKFQAAHKPSVLVFVEDENVEEPFATSVKDKKGYLTKVDLTDTMAAVIRENAREIIVVPGYFAAFTLVFFIWVNYWHALIAVPFLILALWTYSYDQHWRLTRENLANEGPALTATQMVGPNKQQSPMSRPDPFSSVAIMDLGPTELKRRALLLERVGLILEQFSADHLESLEDEFPYQAEKTQGRFEALRTVALDPTASFDPRDILTITPSQSFELVILLIDAVFDNVNRPRQVATMDRMLRDTSSKIDDLVQVSQKRRRLWFLHFLPNPFFTKLKTLRLQDILLYIQVATVEWRAESGAAVEVYQGDLKGEHLGDLIKRVLRHVHPSRTEITLSDHSIPTKLSFHLNPDFSISVNSRELREIIKYYAKDSSKSASVIIHNDRITINFTGGQSSSSTLEPDSDFGPENPVSAQVSDRSADWPFKWHDLGGMIPAKNPITVFNGSIAGNEFDNFILIVLKYLQMTRTEITLKHHSKSADVSFHLNPNLTLTENAETLKQYLNNYADIQSDTASILIQPKRITIQFSEKRPENDPQDFFTRRQRKIVSNVIDPIVSEAVFRYGIMGLAPAWMAQGFFLLRSVILPVAHDPNFIPVYLLFAISFLLAMASVYGYAGFHRFFADRDAFPLLRDYRLQRGRIYAAHYFIALMIIFISMELTIDGLTPAMFWHLSAGMATLPVIGEHIRHNFGVDKYGGIKDSISGIETERAEQKGRSVFRGSSSASVSIKAVIASTPEIATVEWSSLVQVKPSLIVQHSVSDLTQADQLISDLQEGKFKDQVAERLTERLQLISDQLIQLKKNKLGGVLIVDSDNRGIDQTKSDLDSLFRKFGIASGPSIPGLARVHVQSGVNPASPYAAALFFRTPYVQAYPLQLNGPLTTNWKLDDDRSFKHMPPHSGVGILVMDLFTGIRRDLTHTLKDAMEAALLSNRNA